MQYRRLLRGAGDDCLLLVQSGRYFECYGPQRLRAQTLLGLQPINGSAAHPLFASVD